MYRATGWLCRALCAQRAFLPAARSRSVSVFRQQSLALLYPRRFCAAFAPGISAVFCSGRFLFAMCFVTLEFLHSCKSIRENVLISVAGLEMLRNECVWNWITCDEVNCWDRSNYIIVSVDPSQKFLLVCSEKVCLPSLNSELCRLDTCCVELPQWLCPWKRTKCCNCWPVSLWCFPSDVFLTSRKPKFTAQVLEKAGHIRHTHVSLLH